LAQEKQCGSAYPRPANRQLRPTVARAKRDLPLPNPIKRGDIGFKIIRDLEKIIRDLENVG
jgi:hypothetical protein